MLRSTYNMYHYLGCNITKIIEIEAESINDAIAIANENYRNEEIVLDANDFTEVNFLEATS